LKLRLGGGIGRRAFQDYFDAGDGTALVIADLSEDGNA
jgi:hypothetical protein